MALIIRTAAVLTYALQSKDTNGNGIVYQDIRHYCDRLKAAYFETRKDEHACLGFDITNDDLMRCVKEYERQFWHFDGRYYKGVFFDPEAFSREDAQMYGLLKSVSLELSREKLSADIDETPNL
ncbi:hypothetical protein IJV57_04900 [Candidatus Saccharibacteria bacterium]|nr:hypothetical protein [Candidatus Saccharibacteria bacterium]